MVCGLLHPPCKGTGIAASVLHPRVKGGIRCIFWYGSKFSSWGEFEMSRCNCTEPSANGGFHYLHHHKFECNYGVPFPIDFDRIFGTHVDYEEFRANGGRLPARLMKCGENDAKAE